MHKNNKLIFIVFLLIALAFAYNFTITGNVTKVYCIDSDGGENPEERGITIGFKWSFISMQYKKEAQQDKCIPFDFSKRNKVREYFCHTDGYTVTRKNMKCPEGTLCYNGACTNINKISEF